MKKYRTDITVSIKLKIYLIFLIIFFIIFSSCLYSVEKTNLESNDFDSLLVKIKNNEKSFLYPDKDLLKLMEAIILERKPDYKAAIDIYNTLAESEYKIYVKNRIDIITKFYLNPPIKETSPQKEKEESKISKFEKGIIDFLSQDLIKDFFNNFFFIIFDYNNSEEKADDSSILSLIDNLSKAMASIKQNENIQKSLNDLIIQSNNLLNESLPYMTKSKIYFYRFFFFILANSSETGIKQKAVDSLYSSFYNGGLYYYQLLSFCIINRFSKDSNLSNLFNINFISINLSDFLELEENIQSLDFLKKDKNEVKKEFKISFTKSNLKKTEYSSDLIKKHVFLANYFLENNLYLEFSRAIFYLRDLTVNYRIYNSTLIDFYNMTEQYDKAIYYKWDTILTEYFPISLTGQKKISIKDLVCIFPLWFSDIIKDNIEKYKANFEPQILEDSILADPYFYLAIINAESSFSTTITSTANAIGLMQLLPSTAAWLRKTSTLEAKQSLAEPYYNIESGFLYILYLSKSFNGNIISILGAYNSGHNAFSKKKASQVHPLLIAELYPVSETSIYIKKIIRNYLFYKLLYEKIPFEDSIKKIILQSQK